MSLSDLQKQVNETGAKTLADQHGKIMREGEAHIAQIEHQEQAQMAKTMKTVAKTMKSLKGGLGH